MYAGPTMFLQRFILAVYLAFYLVRSEYGQGLNYAMINILELSPNNSADNEPLPKPCNYESDTFSIELPSTQIDDSDTLPTTPYDGGSNSNTTDEPPLDQLTTGHDADQQTTLPPTPSETAPWTHTDNEAGVTNSPTESPFTAICNPEPLQCSRVINITWLSIPPFIFHHKNTSNQPMNGNTDLTGVFYSIIGRAVQFCCKYMDQRGTRIQYTHQAWNKSKLHANIFYGDATIALPVYIENEFVDFSYAGSLKFIEVLESPGLVLISDKNNAKESSKEVVWRAIANEWPVVLISLLLCAISGIFVWALVSQCFPLSFPLTLTLSLNSNV